MTRWHNCSDEAGKKSCLRYAAEHAQGSGNGKSGERGAGRTDTTVGECRNDLLDRVARC